jgi:hypothetical protein
VADWPGDRVCQASRGHGRGRDDRDGQRTRRQYAGYQPVFWRPAADAEQLHRPYLARLVENQDVITLVSEDSGLFTGFLIATIGDAPGVYDPGGRTCQIDDFAPSPRIGGPPQARSC